VLIIGFALTAASLIFLTTLGDDIGGLYQSPRIEDGQVVPGHFKDK
jgi:hypothetical protein